MTTPTTCPHCGAERTEFRRFWYDCSTHVNGKPSAYCRERAAHAATKVERDFANEAADQLRAKLIAEEAAHAATRKELETERHLYRQAVEIICGIQREFEAVIGQELTPPFLPDDAKAILSDLTRLRAEVEGWRSIAEELKGYAGHNGCGQFRCSEGDCRCGLADTLKKYNEQKGGAA